MYQQASSLLGGSHYSMSVGPAPHTTEYPGRDMRVPSNSPPSSYSQSYNDRRSRGSGISSGTSSHSGSTSSSQPPATAATSIDTPPSFLSTGGDTTLYTFRQSDFNSMQVVNQEERTPVYSITVLMNCFSPLTSTTSVYRLSPGQGYMVGAFETGISSIEGRISFSRGNKGNQNITDVFKKHSGTRFSRDKAKNWEWTRDPWRLIWEKSPKGNEYTCYTSRDRDHSGFIARLRWVTPGPPSSVTLEVANNGHDILDDILVSALLVEHRRRCPMEGEENRGLFN